MFEIGWTEMLVIAIVMIVVVGPKDLPQMLRQFGRTATKLRGMAGDFRKQFDEALKEAELDDVKTSVDQLRGLNPAAEVRKQLNPFSQAAQDVRAGLETAMKPKPPIASEPASSELRAAEPLKNGATEIPFVGMPVPAPLGDSPAITAAAPPVEPLPKPPAHKRKAPGEAAAAPRKRAPRKPAETPS